MKKLKIIAPWFYEEFPEIEDECAYAKEHITDERWLAHGTIIKNNIANMPWKWSERILMQAENENNVLLPTNDMDVFVDAENNDYRL